MVAAPNKGIFASYEMEMLAHDNILKENVDVKSWNIPPSWRVEVYDVAIIEGSWICRLIIRICDFSIQRNEFGDWD